MPHYCDTSPYLFVLRHVVPLEAPHFKSTNVTEFFRVFPRQFCVVLRSEGQRPTETAHQALSLCGFSAEVRRYRNKEWYCTGDSTPTEISASKSPTYSTHCTRIPNTKLQCVE